MALTKEQRQQIMAKARAARMAKIQQAKALIPEKAKIVEPPLSVPLQNEMVGAAEGPMMLQGDAVHMVVYDRVTGVPSRIRIEQYLDRVLEDGAPFQDDPLPGKTYVLDARTHLPRLVNTNALKCHLHPQHPNREHYDTIGLAGRTCTKDSIPDAFNLRIHMEKKHKTEWAVIQEEIRERERQEDRARQDRMLQALAGRA